MKVSLDASLSSSAHVIDTTESTLLSGIRGELSRIASLTLVLHIARCCERFVVRFLYCFFFVDWGTVILLMTSSR